MRASWKKNRLRRRQRRHHRQPRQASPLYYPLPSSTSIRLLRLKPGNPADRIECELSTVELDEAPPYEAISYVWGDPRTRRRILCNGKKFTCRANLFMALKNVRNHDGVRVLWVDALCINQNDVGERSKQVVLMKEIYGRAVGFSYAWI
jgi:hypothetical protein